MGGWGLAFLSPRLRGVRVFAICVLGQSVGLGFRLRRRNLCSHSRVFLLHARLAHRHAFAGVGPYFRAVRLEAPETPEV